MKISACGAALCVLLIALVIPVQAQNDPVPYNGLDILFLVDQSGSMGGADFGYPYREATDPLALRFEAVQYALDTLGSYRLQIAPDLSIRMAVVNFGDEPVKTLEWTSIAEDATEWITERDQLLQALSADAFRGDFDPANLGNTNFLAAFETAKAMFESLPASVDQRHLQVIILLTDGAPCVVSGPGAFQCGDEIAEQQHMDDVAALVQQVFSPPDHLLYILALDAVGEFWVEREQDWKTIVADPGRATRVESSQEIGIRFLEILAQLVSQTEVSNQGTAYLPSKLVPGRNIISVPPYQRQMRLSIFKSTNSPGAISATQPNGIVLQPGDPMLTINNQDRPIETWTIMGPQPGDWMFDVGSAGDRIDVYLELIPVDVAAEITTGSLQQFEAVTLTLQLIDAISGTPLPVYDPPYDLNVGTTLTLPDGSTETLTLVSTGQGQYEVSYIPLLSGLYTLSVQASTTLPSGQEFMLYNRANVGTFDIIPLGLLVEGCPVNDQLVGEILTLTAQLTDVNGETLQQPDQRISAELRSDTTSAVYDLSDPDGDGIYSSPITLEQVGTFQFYVTAKDVADRLLGEFTSPSFTVLPSELINLTLISPHNKDEQYVTGGFPPTSETSLDIVFETRLAADNRLIDVQSLALDPAAGSVLSLNLVQGNQTHPLVFEQGTQPGQYRASVPALDAGTYIIEVQTAGTLHEPYIFNPLKDSVRATVKRVTNPLLYVFYGGLILSGILLTGGSLWRILGTRHRRRQHPVRGVLAISEMEMANNEQNEIWRIDLNHMLSNDILLKRRKLPSRAPISSLRIRCDNDQMSSRRQVRVTAKQGKRVIIQDRVLTPGGSVVLSQGPVLEPGQPLSQDARLYYLLKDPDDYGLGRSDSFMF